MCTWKQSFVKSNLKHVYNKSRFLFPINLSTISLWLLDKSELYRIFIENCTEISRNRPISNRPDRYRIIDKTVIEKKLHIVLQSSEEPYMEKILSLIFLAPVQRKSCVTISIFKTLTWNVFLRYEVQAFKAIGWTILTVVSN